MINKCIIFYELNNLYQIFEEISDIVDFQILKISKNERSKLSLYNSENFLIITNKKILNINNQFLFKEYPIKIEKLIEDINICLLKQTFYQQSKIDIGKYTINLNSRLIFNEKKSLKLTEKEVSTIIFLFNNKSPVQIDELQSKVWGYQSDLDTHTVETHIYRLRKKIFKIFHDENFIFSSNKGYQIL